jgi:hypothetical protein
MSDLTSVNGSNYENNELAVNEPINDIDINSKFKIQDDLRSKLENFMNSRIDSLQNKFEEDLEKLEKSKYNYYDVYQNFNTSIMSTDDEFNNSITLEDSVYSISNSEILNNTNDVQSGPILNTKSKIREKTPMRANNKSFINSTVNTNNNFNSTNNQSSGLNNNLKKLNRSKTPLRKEKDTTNNAYNTNTNNTTNLTKNKERIFNNIPNNISKRIEARRMSSNKRDSTPIGLLSSQNCSIYKNSINITESNNNMNKENNKNNKDKSPLIKNRIQVTKRIDKSPYPYPKRTTTDSNSIKNNIGNNEADSSLRLGLTKNSSVVLSKNQNSASTNESKTAKKINVNKRITQVHGQHPKLSVDYTHSKSSNNNLSGFITHTTNTSQIYTKKSTITEPKKLNQPRTKLSTITKDNDSILNTPVVKRGKKSINEIKEKTEKSNNLNRSMIDDPKKRKVQTTKNASSNVTNNTINKHNSVLNNSNNNIRSIKDDKDLTKQKNTCKDFNYSFISTLDEKDKKPERSKTPMVLKKKFAKISKKRTIKNKGLEVLSLICSLR